MLQKLTDPDQFPLPVLYKKKNGRPLEQMER